jgi:hypothetical protein
VLWLNFAVASSRNTFKALQIGQTAEPRESSGSIEMPNLLRDAACVVYLVKFSDIG